MESQSSLPIQYRDASKPAISRESEKKQNNAETSRSSFQTSLSESIIDVYERSEVNAAVPDERTGIDRRTSSARRRASSESAPLPSGEKATDIDPYSTKRKINQTYNKTEIATPAFFSPSQKKGSLLDIWA